MLRWFFRHADSASVIRIALPLVVVLLALGVAGPGPALAQEFPVDNDSGSPAYVETGSWSTGASPGYASETYRTTTSGGTATATWNASLPQSGPYAVFVIYRAGSNRVTSAKFQVPTPGGTQTVLVNQQSHDLSWVRLGTWTFETGAASVTLDAAGSSGGLIVCADAVRFVYYGGTPTPTPTPTAIPTTRELRGIWVTGWGEGFKTADEVAALVALARDHHFNALFAEVRKRGDAYYFPTFPNIEPRADDIAPDFDPLQELIDQAHPYGIEVHAWIVANNVENATTSTSPNHVVNAHPEYLMKDNTGGTFISEGYYLDPGNPAANQWNANVVMDLVTHYDIDGIHYDYIRYPGSNSGYNDVAVARYQAEFADAEPPWPGSSLPAPTDEQWKAWRRRQITDWMRATYVDILAVKPAMKVSAAVFANEASARGSVFQDWPAWMDERLLDALCPMNYSDDFATFHALAEFDNNAKNGRHCYMGQACYQNTLAGTAAQLLDARALGCEGTLLFQYLATNSEGIPNPEFYEYIRNSVYNEPALLPEMPWKTRPAGGYLRGRATDASSSATLYNVLVSIDGATTTALTDAVGRYAFIYLSPGTYTIRAAAPGYAAKTIHGVSIAAGEVATLDIALVPDPSTIPTPTPTPILVADLIVDNDDGPPAYKEVGAWSTGGATGYDELTYRYASSGPNNFARWSAWLEPGDYEISVIYRASPNRSTAVAFIVATADGDRVARIDQTANNLTWVSLGRHALPGGHSYVTLDASDAEPGAGVVIADAVRFHKVGDPPATPTPAMSPTATPAPSPTTGTSGAAWTVK